MALTPGFLPALASAGPHLASARLCEGTQAAEKGWKEAQGPGSSGQGVGGTHHPSSSASFPVHMGTLGA